MILYYMSLKVAKRVDIKCSHHTQNLLCKIKDVLTNLTVVIIFQYMCEKSSHFATLYNIMSIRSQ